jgi:hypothetical protein
VLFWCVALPIVDARTSTLPKIRLLLRVFRPRPPRLRLPRHLGAIVFLEHTPVSTPATTFAPSRRCDCGGISTRRLLPSASTPVLSAFRPRGVPGPTSELSPRVPAQMGRRETEHEGGKKTGKGGNPRPSCCPAPRSGALAVGGYKRSRGRALCIGPFSRATNLLVREPWTFLL